MTKQVYSILDPAYQQDPYLAYRTFRFSQPVHFGPPVLPGEQNTLYLFRHQDVTDALSNPKLAAPENPRFMSEGVCRMIDALSPERRAFHAMIQRWMLFLDPPEHTPLKRSISGKFSMKEIKHLEVKTHQVAARLIADMVGQREVDFMQSFAIPFPVLMNCHLLGLPDKDWEQLERWGAEIIAAKENDSSRDTRQRAGEATVKAMAYFDKALNEKRRHPQNDLMSHLVEAVDAQAMEWEDAVAMCSFLVVAAHETVTTFLGNAFLALIQHPVEKQELLGYGEQIPDLAIEELLRYSPPVLFVFRRAMEDTQVCGVPVAQGGMVGILLGSANRDPEVFEDPERLNLRRKANPHLSFGRGVHFCLGTMLVRFQSKIIFPLLVKLIQQISIEQTEVRRNASHGFETLKISFR